MAVFNPAQSQGSGDGLQIYVIPLMPLSESGLTDYADVGSRAWNDIRINGTCIPNQTLYLSYAMLNEQKTNITDRSESYLVNTKFDTIIGTQEGTFSYTGKGVGFPVSEWFPFYNDVGLIGVTGAITDYTAVALWCY